MTDSVKKYLLIGAALLALAVYVFIEAQGRGDLFIFLSAATDFTLRLQSPQFPSKKRMDLFVISASLISYVKLLNTAYKSLIWEFLAQNL